MDILVLGAKSGLAAILLVAAGAKMADLANFAVTIALFVPRRISYSIRRCVAVIIALAELILGAASLSLPHVRWLNAYVFALACAFLGVSGVGYAIHRGYSCQCFGALSQRNFDFRGLLRASMLVGLAAVAMFHVPQPSLSLDAGAHVLLGAAAALLVLVAFTAARALPKVREAHPRMAR